MYAMNFSRTECRALAAMLDGKEPEMEEKPLTAFKKKLEGLAH